MKIEIYFINLSFEFKLNKIKVKINVTIAALEKVKKTPIMIIIENKFLLLKFREFNIKYPDNNMNETRLLPTISFNKNISIKFRNTIL